MYTYTDTDGNLVTYKHALLDTNVISDMIKAVSEDQEISSRIVTKALDEHWLLSVSPINSIELANQQWLLEKFYQFCSAFQIVALLKSDDQILREEIKNWLESQSADICPHTSIVAQIRGPKGEKLVGYDVIKQMFERSGINEWATKIETAAQKRLEDDEIKREAYHEYCRVQGPKVVSRNVIQYQLKSIDRRLAGVDCSRFPSMQSQFAGSYYKFYENKKRKVTVNDVKDLQMFSILPYMDVFISEGDNIDIVKKIKHRFGLLNNLETYQMTDFRDSKSGEA